MAHEHKLIYQYLKTHGASTVAQIAGGISTPSRIVSEGEVQAILDDHKGKNYINHDLTTGKYSVKFMLGKPLEVHKKDNKAWNYKRIRTEMLAGGGVQPPTVQIPDTYTNPYLKYLPDHIDQQDRGTCVGFSTAIATTLAYLMDTQDFPTPAEIAAEKRNQQIDLGCANGKPFVFDVFEKRWKSPEYCYNMSRIVGNVTDPEGSYVSASAKSLTINGSVFETECQTAKTPTCVPMWYPALPGESGQQTQDRIMASGKSRITQGYAAITDFNTICEAIYTHGYALIAVNIYENYTDGGCVGNLPEPRGEVVGGHALCLTGYDMTNRTLQVRMSWGTNWSNESGFSENYFNQAASECYVILDANETKIGQQLYTNVTLDANVPCTFVVNGEPTDTIVNNVVTIERGITHTITATAIDPTTVVQPAIANTITTSGDTAILDFAFTPVGSVPKKNLIELIVELIDAILNLLKKI